MEFCPNEKLQQNIKTKDDTIRNMGVEMRKLQKELDEARKIATAQPAPLHHNISTPPTPRRDNNTPRGPTTIQDTGRMGGHTIIAGIISSLQEKIIFYFPLILSASKTPKT